MNINILRDQKPGPRSQERLGWKGQRQRWIRAEGHGHLKGTRAEGCGTAEYGAAKVVTKKGGT
jgi:hypothetical protein